LELNQFHYWYYQFAGGTYDVVGFQPGGGANADSRRAGQGRTCHPPTGGRRLQGSSHSDRSEHFLVDALRRSGALTLSLIAEVDDAPARYIAFSPVRIGGVFQDWYGLGPVAVSPQHQGSRIGQALIRGGLDRLGAIGAAGCVLLGEPGFYCRFGFKAQPQLTFDGAQAEFFLSLPFGPAVPAGAVEYHSSFYEKYR